MEAVAKWRKSAKEDYDSGMNEEIKETFSTCPGFGPLLFYIVPRASLRRLA